MGETIFYPENIENIKETEEDVVIEFSNDPEPTSKDVMEAKCVLKEALKDPESGAGRRLRELVDGSARLTTKLLNWAGEHKTELAAAAVAGIALLSPEAQAVAQAAAEKGDANMLKDVLGYVFVGALGAILGTIFGLPIYENIRDRIRQLDLKNPFKKDRE